MPGRGGAFLKKRSEQLKEKKKIVGRREGGGIRDAKLISYQTPGPDIQYFFCVPDCVLFYEERNACLAGLHFFT